MKLINDKKNPTLLGTTDQIEEVRAIQRMVDNLLKDSAYEEDFSVITKGSNVYIKHTRD